MSSMSRSSIFLFVIAVGLAKRDESAVDPDSPCANGSCPNALGEDTSLSDGGGEECTLWIGPSDIKQHHDHGFGLGMFTGVDIPKGSFVGPEDGILLPITDSKTLAKNHPPLREYVWHRDLMTEVPLETNGSSWLFMSGLPAIAPCTWVNYNCEFSGPGDKAGISRRNVASAVPGIPPRSDPLAGSFTYRHSVSFTAVRDIVAGEELTVKCDDDNFDGGAFFLSNFKSDDATFVCLDNVKAGASDIGGAGLFAKRRIAVGDTIISTPLIPVHRKELQVNAPAPAPKDLLALNYAFGHANSDLLLLPYGPLVNNINHPTEGKVKNAKLRWHPLDSDRNDGVPRRQQVHHPELLDQSADVVAETHGKGLMVDVVALRDIEEGEEIYLDYGSDWVDAWRAHVNGWKPNEKDTENYISAEEFARQNDISTIRTAAEQEETPYPENLQTACFYDGDAPVVEAEGDVGTDGNLVHTSWITELPHECLRPCIILGRYKENRGDEEFLYRARMLPFQRPVRKVCKLEGAHIAREVPRHAIRITDRPYTSDAFLEGAFRHEIGVPADFYPEAWMRKKMRRRPDLDADIVGDEFKKKNAEDAENKGKG